LLNKLVFAESFKRRKPRDFFLAQTHLTRPATAGRATLTLQKNRHTKY
jgi:hypothetical protein